MSRIRLAFALFLLTLVASFHSAQEAEDETPTPDPDVELNRLYKQEGRSWTHRTVKWTRGEGASVETETTSVDSFDGDQVRTSYSVEYENGGGGGSSSFSIDYVDEQDKWYVDEELPVETLDMGFRKFRCRKHRVTEDGLQSTTWTSTEFHPLIVKQATLGKDRTTVRKLTSFYSAEVDPWLLYRIEGRSWTVRNTMDLGGGTTSVTHTRNTVVEVTDEFAKVETETLDENQEPLGGIEPVAYEVPFAVPEGTTKARPAEAPRREMKEIGLGEFDCLYTESGELKAWSSAVYPGLTVCIETGSMNMELVEFDLGHDYQRFYRTVGNYYVLKSSTKVAGMNMESSMRYEVTKVENGESTYTVTTLDAQGNAMNTFTQTMPLDDADGEDAEDEDEPERKVLHPWSGEQEELITTEAGAFCAILTEVESGGMKTKVWIWNGVNVLSETRGDGMETRMELTDYSIE